MFSASNQTNTSFMNVEDLIKIYKNPDTHDEYIRRFEHIIDEKKSKINDIVKVYNTLNFTSIEQNNQLYFKVVNYDGKSKTTNFKIREGFNFDERVDEVIKTFDENTIKENTDFRMNKIFDVSGFSYCKLEDLHMYGNNNVGGYIHPIVIPNSIPVLKELEFNGNQYKMTKYKSPLVYTLPKIKLGSEESIKLLMNTNNMNDNFLKNYLYCSNDIENLIKFENLYSCYDKEMSNKMRNKYIHAYVKRMILQKRYDVLYNKIVNKSKIGYGIDINLTELFYLFYKHRDDIFVKYLREYFFNKIIEKNKQKLDSTIIDINISNSTLKLHEFLEKNEKISKFFDYVFEKNGVVSGSFALKYFTNMDWQSSDIDVYVHSEHKEDVMKYAKQNNLTHWNSVTNCGNGNMRYNMNGVNSMANLYNTEIPIQLIFVECEPWEFIKTNFDFDICMVGYRNNEFLYHHNNLTKFNEGIVVDKYINKMVGDEKDNYSVYRAAKTIERLVKYIERGFNITNIDHFLNQIEVNMY